MRKTIMLAALLAPGSLLAATTLANAAAYTFTQIDQPGAEGTVLTGINNVGELVGFGSGSFVDTAGTFTSLNVPGADGTSADGINDKGQGVGYVSGEFVGHGFLYSDGNFTTVDVPGMIGQTNAYGINNASEIVGIAGTHGFLYSRGIYTILDAPDGTVPVTTTQGINNEGQIVGYSGPPFDAHAFLYTAGAFTALDTPSGSFPLGINDAGEIVGRFDDRAGTEHGFLIDHNGFHAFDVPGALSTFARGINDSGQIVGGFMDSTGREHGFLATPTSAAVPEPSSLVLLGVGVIGGFVMRRRAVTRA
jgi:probable HAF family extracellular repeat protein